MWAFIVSRRVVCDMRAFAERVSLPPRRPYNRIAADSWSNTNLAAHALRVK